MNMRLLAARLAATAVVAAALGWQGIAANAASNEAMLQDGADLPTVPALHSVIGGNDASFDLKQASTGKTLVLYFFPQAFTED